MPAEWLGRLGAGLKDLVDRVLGEAPAAGAASAAREEWTEADHRAIDEVDAPIVDPWQPQDSAAGSTAAPATSRKAEQLPLNLGVPLHPVQRAFDWHSPPTHGKSSKEKVGGNQPASDPPRSPPYSAPSTATPPVTFTDSLAAPVAPTNERPPQLARSQSLATAIPPTVAVAPNEELSADEIDRADDAGRPDEDLEADDSELDGYWDDLETIEHEDELAATDDEDVPEAPPWRSPPDEMAAPALDEGTISTDVPLTGEDLRSWGADALDADLLSPEFDAEIDDEGFDSFDPIEDTDFDETSFGIEPEIHDFDETARRPLWHQDLDDEPVAHRTAKQKAAELAGLVDAVNVREQREVLTRLIQFFQHLRHPSTFKEIRSAVEEGIDATTLIAMVELRRCWLEHSEWWLVRWGDDVRQAKHGASLMTWKLARLVCERRCDFPPEQMIDEAWLDEWLVLSWDDAGYRYFPEYIKFRVSHPEHWALADGYRMERMGFSPGRTP